MRLTNSSLNCVLAGFVLIAKCSSLQAADPIQVPWERVCSAAQGNQLTLTTTGGNTVDGYCVAVSVNEVSVRTKDKSVVKIARATLSRLQMHRPNSGHQVSTLGSQFHKGMTKELDWLLSPHAALGIVTIPPTLAWGAVTLPFCALGDLKDKLAGAREIQIK
jgi:hypothetical protein